MNKDYVVIKLSKSAILSNDSKAILKEVNTYLENQPTNYEETKKSLASFLKRMNKKETQERYKVLERICAYKGVFTKKDIHRSVINEMYISRATVANTINLLLEANILNRLVTREELFGVNYFELRCQ